MNTENEQLIVDNQLPNIEDTESTENTELELEAEDEQNWYEHMRKVVDKGQSLLRIDK